MGVKGRTKEKKNQRGPQPIKKKKKKNYNQPDLYGTHHQIRSDRQRIKSGHTAQQLKCKQNKRKRELPTLISPNRLIQSVFSIGPLSSLYQHRVRGMDLTNGRTHPTSAYRDHSPKLLI